MKNVDETEISATPLVLHTNHIYCEALFFFRLALGEIRNHKNIKL
jgi:hypothetical protein